MLGRRTRRGGDGTLARERRRSASRAGSEPRRPRERRRSARWDHASGIDHGAARSPQGPIMGACVPVDVRGLPRTLDPLLRHGSVLAQRLPRDATWRRTRSARASHLLPPPRRRARPGDTGIVRSPHDQVVGTCAAVDDRGVRGKLGAVHLRVVRSERGGRLDVATADRAARAGDPASSGGAVAARANDNPDRGGGFHHPAGGGADPCGASTAHHLDRGGARSGAPTRRSVAADRRRRARALEAVAGSLVA